MNKFTLVVNAGRSGSTFLEQILKVNFSNDCYIGHEDIPVQISKPRLYNRAYSKERIELILKDVKLMHYINKWQEELQIHPIIETGWTSYHLCPILLHIFKEKFQIIVLHRDPVSFAFSRANMGNYHTNTFYDDAHEVSPFDPFSIAPQKENIWLQMNHFERCMYWWWIVYQEGLEFIDKNPQVPYKIIKSKDIFNFKSFDEILTFMQLNPSKLLHKNVEKNPLAQFMRETFPIRDEWQNYDKHKDILKFAYELGAYTYTKDKVKETSLKYKLPVGLSPKIRNKINYWKIKGSLKNYFYKVSKNS